METVMAEETKIAYVTTTGVLGYLVIGKGVVEGYEGLGLVIPFVIMVPTMAVSVILVTYVLRAIFSIIIVRGTVWEVSEIKERVDKVTYGAFGYWEKVEVKLKNTSTGKEKKIAIYPDKARGLHVGEKVNIVYKKRRHTYEMSTYRLIPEKDFNIKTERMNYIKG